LRDIDAVRALRRMGWKLDRISGSHYILKKDGDTVVIPVHNRDMKPGLLRAIQKKTGLK